MSKLRLASLVVVASLTAAALPAHGDQVIVGVSNPGGTRTLYVEDLLGSPLTTLDLVDGRSQAFRVRVGDVDFDRAGFQVLANMTNLYRQTGPGAYDFSTPLPSGNVTVGTAAQPLNARNVSTLVQPAYDVASTVTGTLCTTLTLLGATCTIAASAVPGLRQTLDQVVNLAQLPKLPLVPQAGASGPFTNPAYAGVAAAAPQPPGAPAATAHQLLAGTVGVDLTSIQATLGALVAGTPATGLIPTATLTQVLRDSLGLAYDSLSALEVQALLDGLVATVRTLVPADVLSQVGTYLSFPTLRVDVPSGLPSGDYDGTLVVTLVQP